MTMPGNFATSCAMTAAMLLLACSGKTEGTADAAGTAPSESAFLSTRPAAAREVFSRCCPQLYGVTVDTSQMTDDPYATNLPASHLVYDPALGTECLALLNGMAASCSQSKAAADALDRACFGYRGTLAPGALCASDNECATPPGSQARCLTPVSATGLPTYLPNCAVLDRGAEGDTCLAPMTVTTVTGLHFCDPADGLFCNDPGTCQRRRAEGETCIPSSSQYPYVCADGLYCAGQSWAPRKPLGAPCDFNHAACLSGTCDQAAGVCVAAEPVPSAGKCGVRPDAATPAPMADAAGG
jgi:hypothetical protein